MKRASVALALGFSFVAAQGCMAEPMDESEIGSADQAMCESLSYSKVMAALLVAMADEVDELHPTKYLAVQPNKYGWGIDGVVLTSAATNKCGTCDKMQGLLELQGVTGIDPAVLNVPDYRANLVNKLKDQQIWENGQTCLPPDHSLGAPMDAGQVECGEHYSFEVSFGGGAGGFEVTREAESYNAYNRNNSQHNWSQSGGSMTIGPDWNHTWTYYSTAPNLSYSINFPAAGNYKVWLRGMGSNASNDSAYVGINNSSNNAMVDLPENNQYGWAAGDIYVPGAGTHNVQVYAREDGFFFDKLVVNQSSTPPAGGGGSCPAPVPNDLKKRIDRFQVNSAGYVGFSADASKIFLDPDDTVDPIGGGSGSGSDACSATPPSPGGSDVLQMPYKGNEDKEGDCCWQNYVQKTYKRHQQRFLVCKT